MRVDLEDLVAAVHALHEEAFGRPCHFHLSRCAICGAPSFAYPCPNCGRWADHGESPTEIEAQRRTAAASGIGGRAAFVAGVERAGGLGAWYFGAFRRTVAYGGERGRVGVDPAFRRAVDDLVARAGEVEWPDPGEIWDAVTGGGRQLPDPGFWRGKREAWDRLGLEIHGADCLATLKGQRDRQGYGFAWPENCPEGRDIVRAVARAD